MLIASDKMYNILSTTPIFTKQSGAVEACWAHNPEVRGSKPRSAKRNLLLIALIVSLSRGLVANRKMFERVDSASFLVRVQR